MDELRVAFGTWEIRNADTVKAYKDGLFNSPWIPLPYSASLSEEAVRRFLAKRPTN